MFMSISDALVEIKETVQEALGPLGNGFVFTTSDFMDIGIQLISTLILFIVVRCFLWKPVTNILESRRAAIDKEFSEAKEAKENAVQIEAELREELNKAKARVKEMLDNAEKEANIKRDEIINTARQEAKTRIENLQLELKQEKESMAKQIRQEIIDIAFAAAEKIVSREINQDKYLDVVDEILKEAAS